MFGIKSEVERIDAQLTELAGYWRNSTGVDREWYMARIDFWLDMRNRVTTKR